MKLTIEDPYRIRIAPEIIGSFENDFAYFGVSPSRKDFSVMPVLYMTAFGAEYDRLDGKRIPANGETRTLFRRFFSHIDASRIGEGGRIVIPEKVRETFWLVPGEILEARVVGQRMIISPDVQ